MTKANTCNGNVFAVGLAYEILQSINPLRFIISAFGRMSLPVAEITPTEVKKYVTGNGSSEKKIVADALFRLLNFEKGRLPYDVTDALAIAFSYPLSVKI